MVAEFLNGRRILARTTVSLPARGSTSGGSGHGQRQASAVLQRFATYSTANALQTPELRQHAQRVFMQLNHALQFESGQMPSSAAARPCAGTRLALACVVGSAWCKWEPPRGRRSSARGKWRCRGADERGWLAGWLVSQGRDGGVSFSSLESQVGSTRHHIGIRTRTAH
jgi:hypothetical protein